MPTEHDLRAALSTLADRAPVTCPLPSADAIRPRRRMTRLVLPGLAAAAVVAIAAISLVAAHPGPPALVAASPTTSAFVAPGTMPTSEYIFDIAPVPGWTSYQSRTMTTMQTMVLTKAIVVARPPDPQHGVVQDPGPEKTYQAVYVDLYPRGGFQPPRPSEAASVSIKGVEGFYGTIKTFEGFGAESMGGAVAWPYAPDAWAIAYSPGPTHLTTRPAPIGPGLTKGLAVQIADAVRPGATHPVLTPVRVASLPSEVVPAAVPQVEPVTPATAGIGLTGIGIESVTNTQLTRSLGISIYIDGRIPDAGDTAFGRTAVQFGAFHGSFYPDANRLDVTNGKVAVQVGAGVPGGVFSLADLEATVEGLTFASNTADQSTWFPISELLP